MQKRSLHQPSPDEEAEARRCLYVLAAIVAVWVGYLAWVFLGSGGNWVGKIVTSILPITDEGRASALMVPFTIFMTSAICWVMTIAAPFVLLMSTWEKYKEKYRIALDGYDFTQYRLKREARHLRMIGYSRNKAGEKKLAKHGAGSYSCVFWLIIGVIVGAIIF